MFAPKIAVRSDDIPTEKELKAAQSKADKAQVRRDKAGTSAAGKRGERENALNKFNENADKLLGPHEDISADIRKRKAEYQQEIAKTDKEIKQKDMLISERKEKQELADKNDADIKKLEERLVKGQKVCDDALSQMKEAQGNCTEKEKSLAEEFEKHFGDSSWDNADRKAAEFRSAAQKGCEKAKAAVGSADKKVRESQDTGKKLEDLGIEEKKNHDEITKIGSDIAANKKACADKQAERKQLLDDPGFDGTEEELKKKDQLVRTLNENKKAIDNGISEVENRIKDNTKAANGLKKKGADLGKAEKRYAMIEELEKAASGNLGGQDRVSFETYVLQNNFGGMVADANRLLYEMTDEHYTLETAVQKNKNRKAGLDLELFDHWNGSYRDVKTLSGGESFLAALALALGLSEEVQSSKGGVQLDSMFVDEGFGSLDEESLDLVMNALDELSRSSGSRLIGIISHVDELKNRIDKRISIRKDQFAGSTAEVSC